MKKFILTLIATSIVLTNVAFASTTNSNKIVSNVDQSIVYNPCTLDPF